MKAGPFTNEPIVAILQRAAKVEQTISGRCQSKGISEATFYSGRKKFGGMAVRDARTPRVTRLGRRVHP